MQPLAVAVHPTLDVPTYFVIAPDHTVMWYGLWGGIADWRSLGGWVRAIAAWWTRDGSTMHLVGVGQDDRLWSRSYGFETGAWSDWEGAGPLHLQEVVADS